MVSVLSSDTNAFNSQSVKFSFYDVVKLVFNLVLVMAERNLISDHTYKVCYISDVHLSCITYLISDFGAFNAQF